MPDTFKHACFYIDTITFRVDDCLFRVPREPFETESTTFKEEFLRLTGHPRHAKGKSDENPIRLAGVTKDEFEQFLRVLLHRLHGLPHISLPKTTDEWMSVLELAHVWGFGYIFQAAIDRLQDLASPAEKIVLGQTYGLNFMSWSLPAMHEIVRRPQPISFEEGQCMGFEMALKLASVRERISVRKKPYTNHGFELTPGYRPDVKGLDFTQTLREVYNQRDVANLYKFTHV